MSEEELLERVTFNPKIFGGKPIIRGRRLAVEHVLGMLAAESFLRRSSRNTVARTRGHWPLAWCSPDGMSGMRGSSRL